MDSILTSIKKLLGIEEDYTHFDNDLIVMINSVLSVLVQLGVGIPGYAITDKSDNWEDFFDSEVPFEAVKSYVYLRVKLMFDPPQSSAAIESMTQMAKEYEWRSFVHHDPPLIEEGEGDDDA